MVNIVNKFGCFLYLLFLCMPFRLQAEKLIDFKFDKSRLDSSTSSSQTTCGFQEEIKLTKDFVVFAAGGYSGKEMDFQIDQSGHQATKIDVIVNYTKKPIILMLGAYEPTIWNLGWSSKTKIIAVFASGYHRQALAGLKEDIPYLISTYDNKGRCGSAYVSEENQAAFDALSRKLFDRPVEKVFPANNGFVIIGDSVKSTTKLLTSGSKTVESFIDKNAPLAGQAGVRDALEKGLLRPAEEKDIRDWLELVKPKEVQAQSIKKTPRNTKEKLNIPSNSYVVLKPFTFPSGLFGGNAVIFFIPKGVPNPTGNPGQSTVHNFNTATSSGPLSDLLIRISN